MATNTIFNLFRKNQNDGTAVIDFNTDTIKVALATNSYVPSVTLHDFFSDVTNEVTGTNYTADGETITTPTLTETGGVATFDGDDVGWLQNAGGFTDARFGIVYKDTGVASTSPLIGFIDLVSDKGNVAGDLNFNWNASGILTWS